jgi:hypothetical protein
MDPNPYGTFTAAKQAHAAAVTANENAPSDEATRKLEQCKRALDEADMLVAEAAANAECQSFKEEDIKLEEQVGNIWSRLLLPCLRFDACLDAG